MRTDKKCCDSAVPQNRFSWVGIFYYAKSGGKIARAGWNGKGMWVAVQYPDEHSKMKHPYLYMSTVDGTLIPWLPSQADLFAEDWEVVG